MTDNGIMGDGNFKVLIKGSPTGLVVKQGVVLDITENKLILWYEENGAGIGIGQAARLKKNPVQDGIDIFQGVQLVDDL